ncbi:MAG: NADH-quinone oxidoreductase subunit N [Weeksellaceae bacterium]|jgi:NADH-quinone oxidoreductase subunit N|nr:NADH-quinone oxidoreductase subunit N [Weeksellaceae bacterium]
MNILLTSTLSGIVFMFSGFVLKNKKHQSLLAAFLFVVMIISAVCQINGQEIFAGKYANMIITDTYRVFFFIVLCLIGIYYVLVNQNEFSRPGKLVSDYYALIFISFVGIATLAVSNNLIAMFIGIEILSIPLYALAGSAKHKMKSTEAAVKYFLMGAFSTGVMLMGIALIYGATGSFLLTEIPNYAYDFQSIYYLGWVLLIISLCFKVSVAPMHYWAPDVYDGTPTIFSSYMVTMVKGGAFLAFISVLFSLKLTSEIELNNYRYLITFIILMTLFIGNFSALKQKRVKRMLAYSSVVQAGFMMFALLAVSEESMRALIFYTVSYGLSSIVLFYVMTQTVNVKHYGFNGLSKNSPLLAAVSSIALFSLAGIPFTSGFLGKFFVLSSAMEDSRNLSLVILALIMAVISVYYYIKVIMEMYFKKPKNKRKIKVSSSTKFLLVMGSVLNIGLGVYPDLLWKLLDCFTQN